MRARIRTMATHRWKMGQANVMPMLSIMQIKQERYSARRLGVDYVASDTASSLVLEASIIRRDDSYSARAVASMLDAAAHVVRWHQLDAQRARIQLAKIRVRKVRRS